MAKVDFSKLKERMNKGMNYGDAVKTMGQNGSLKKKDERIFYLGH